MVGSSPGDTTNTCSPPSSKASSGPASDASATAAANTAPPEGLRNPMGHGLAQFHRLVPADDIRLAQVKGDGVTWR